MQHYILAIDQGTSSTKTIIFDEAGKAVARGIEPLKTYYTEGGFAEQDPQSIYENVLVSVKQCLVDFVSKGYDPALIAACGISNQRETFVVWDKQGVPLYNAVVWQCKRSVDICEDLKAQGVADIIKSKTGLLIDPYFSATKLMWLNENVPAVKEAIQGGNAFFGTVDTWLLYMLSKGEAYLTDYTNASRTMLFNLNELQWDNEVISLLGLTGIRLPAAMPSSGFFAFSDFDGLLRIPIPITGVIGDSHAAAFGEGCFEQGFAKATMGTGCSLLMNTGDTPVDSKHGMITTICWSIAGRVDYALEGVIVSCGATIEWIKNELNIFKEIGDAENMATSIPDNNGVYIVPAFSGLGAPHWQMKSKAVISGLGFDCNKNHIVRAALESVGYQIKDVVDAMEQDAGISLKELMTDGGITANGFVMQFLTDLLNRPVARIGMPDVSALGAAYMAGLHVGVYKDILHLKTLNSEKKYTAPSDAINKVNNYYKGWQLAVAALVVPDKVPVAFS